MAIKDIIARGIGFSPGSVKFIVAHGFIAASLPTQDISATDVELPLPVDVELWKQPPGIPGPWIAEKGTAQRRRDVVATPGSRMQTGEPGFTSRTGSLKDVRS